MLIDATHPEETRVVVTRGNRVEEFDYESASRKQLRGNIYLAKVARIEPSLQAAFVNYGGNRHGFLAFAEIHPDYYQIPVAVREALMKEDAADRHSRFQDHHDNGKELEPRNRKKRQKAQQMLPAHPLSRSPMPPLVFRRWRETVPRRRAARLSQKKRATAKWPPLKPRIPR